MANRVVGVGGYSGLYVAQVVSRKDPLKIGRIKARIISIQGEVDETMLSWARPCFPFGAGYDVGSFIVPCEGSYVWIAFEGGDITKPVYLGSVLSASTQNSRSAKFPSGVFGGSNVSIAPNTLARPEDVSGIDVTESVVFKSLKGATISVEDGDDEERLDIVDRGGVALTFISRMSDNSYLRRRGNNSYSKINNLAKFTRLSYAAIKGKRYKLEFSCVDDKSVAELAADKVVISVSGNELVIKGNSGGPKEYKIDLDKLEKLLEEVQP